MGVKFFPLHTIKTYGWGTGCVTSVVTPTLDRADRSFSQPKPFYSHGRNSLCPLNRTLVGSQHQSGCFGEDTNLFSLAGIPPRFLRPTAASPVSVVIMLSQLQLVSWFRFMLGTAMLPLNPTCSICIISKPEMTKVCTALNQY